GGYLWLDLGERVSVGVRGCVRRRVGGRREATRAEQLAADGARREVGVVQVGVEAVRVTGDLGHQLRVHSGDDTRDAVQCRGQAHGSREEGDHHRAVHAHGSLVDVAGHRRGDPALAEREPDGLAVRAHEPGGVAVRVAAGDFLVTGVDGNERAYAQEAGQVHGVRQFVELAAYGAGRELGVVHV